MIRFDNYLDYVREINRRGQSALVGSVPLVLTDARNEYIYQSDFGISLKYAVTVNGVALKAEVIDRAAGLVRIASGDMVGQIVKVATIGSVPV